jgi:hypothetical protein
MSLRYLWSSIFSSGFIASLMFAWSYTQPIFGSTSPSIETSTLKLCPCTPRHLWPSGAFGKVCAASKLKSLVRRARTMGNYRRSTYVVIPNRVRDLSKIRERHRTYIVRTNHAREILRFAGGSPRKHAQDHQNTQPTQLRSASGRRGRDQRLHRSIPNSHGRE